MILRLRYVEEYRDRHGRTRRYFRRPGRPRIPLPGEPGSNEFIEAYRAAQAGMTVKPMIGAGRAASGSTSAALAAYYQDNSFLGLAPGTRSSRRAILERFRATCGDDKIAMLRRPHLVAILGRLKPHASRNWLKALRGFLAFCQSMELIASDPSDGIKRAKAPKTQGHHSWTETEIAQYEAHWPIGTRPRLAMALLLYTTLRRSDIVRLGPQHSKGDRLVITKTANTTGKTLHIALHPALAEIIAATPCNDLAYLVTAYGAPFTAAGFGGWFREQCDAAGLPHCSAHGLKKASLRRAAEAGAGLYGLQAISGNTSPGELQTYVRDADQARLAQQTVELVAKAFPVAREGK
jgi:integrase